MFPSAMHRNVKYKNGTNFNPGLTPTSLSGTLASKIHPGLEEILSSLLRLEQQQKRYLKIHFDFAYFSFFLTHLEFKQ